ncbi:MAG: hypothetical protein EOP48_18300, partial [Sphingobacteriales bacterium]
MRIYLDSNIFRDLNKPEHKDFYGLVRKNKEINYYYFSEAHIQDLVRDETDRKLSDMDFMETIVGDNCWHYDKEKEISFRTPRSYYHDYNWGNIGDLKMSDPFGDLIREGLNAIPINWAHFFDTEEIKSTLPDDLKSILLEPATVLEFMDALTDLSNSLSSEQPRFKRLLQYLHQSISKQNMYEKLGIEGFDGKSVVNLEAFTNSFLRVITNLIQEKDLYNIFTTTQFALDTYGIVKG